MSSITIVTLFAIWFTIFPSLSASSIADDLAPFFSPIVGELCKEVGCGRGKCKMSSKNDLGYECECEHGWKQTAFSNATTTSALKFLPCIIPNCTLDSSCSDSAARAEPRNTSVNPSIFEACDWANCGEGVCKKKSGFSYDCECKEGYSNLLNNTAFPCFKECSFGGNCSNLNLGLPSPHSSNITQPPSLPDMGNQAKSLHREGFFIGMIVLAISIAPLLYII